MIHLRHPANPDVTFCHSLAKEVSDNGDLLSEYPFGACNCLDCVRHAITYTDTCKKALVARATELGDS